MSKASYARENSKYLTICCLFDKLLNKSYCSDNTGVSILVITYIALIILRKWFEPRLSKRQPLTAVLLRTPVTQMIFFNQDNVVLL